MTDFRSEAEFWRFMTSIMPSKHQEMMHLQEGAWCQNEHANNMLPENKTQLESAMSSLPRTEGEDATYMIKETWSNLKQAEDYLIRGIIAFLSLGERSC